MCYGFREAREVRDGRESRGIRVGREARGGREIEPARAGRAPDVRVSEAEREEVVALLGQHYADGRLAVGEYEERVGGALQARTGRDLDDLLADLPPVPAAPPVAAGPGLTWAQVAPYLPRILAVTAVVVLALGSGLWVLWFLWPALALTRPRPPHDNALAGDPADDADVGQDVLARGDGAVASALGVDRPDR
ncbi:MAG TPA: DUF1707 domain-containing protein [Acidimicrobiales bacterium]